MAEAELLRLGHWCALVVNLERRSDRLHKLQGLLSATNPRLRQRLERIEAVDGHHLCLNDAALQEVVEEAALRRAQHAKELGLYTIVHDTDNALVHFDDHLTEGAIACAMSHRKALERVATHPTAEWGLILEDDVCVVVPEADLAISRLLARLPDNWAAVYLGYHDDAGRPHPRGLRLLADETQEVMGAYEVAPFANSPHNASVEGVLVDVEVGGVYDYCWGLFAWMVRRETAQALLDGLFPISTQVDGAISGWLLRAFGPGRVFRVAPEELLFYSPKSEEAQDSDVQTMSSEDVVVEQYGSWSAYMHEVQRPRAEESERLMDLYGLLGQGDESAEWYEACAGDERWNEPNPNEWED